MTLTYLLAYFFTPSFFRFDVPILNISFLRLVEYAWPCKFFLLNKIKNKDSYGSLFILL